MSCQTQSCEVLKNEIIVVMTKAPALTNIHHTHQKQQLENVLTRGCTNHLTTFLISITHTHTHTTVLWLTGLCLGEPGLAGTRKNIHSLTPIVVISHPLSASSIYYDPWHPPCSIYVPDILFPQTKFSLVYLLAWHTPLHTSNISSSNNHCLLFPAYAHTIVTCLLYHLQVVC